MKATPYRAAATRDCPKCQRPIGYYWFSGMGQIFPHFYCDRCSNAFFDRRHRDQLAATEPSPALLEEIVKTLPLCPCGGCFRPGANPKCPSCREPLAHQADAVQRLTDPYCVIVDGAYLVTPD